MDKKIYDGLVILDRELPLVGAFGGVTIYGFYINLKKLKFYKNDLSHYSTYLLGVSQLYKEGGYIADEDRKWHIPKYKLHVNFDVGATSFLNVLLKDFISYRIVRIDPIEETGGDGLVIDPKVIERYSNNESIEIGGKK